MRVEVEEEGACGEVWGGKGRAHGECGEAAAVAELVERLALVRSEEPAAARAHAGRTVALLTGLVRKFA